MRCVSGVWPAEATGTGRNSGKVLLGSAGFPADGRRARTKAPASGLFTALLAGEEEQGGFSARKERLCGKGRRQGNRMDCLFKRY
jgi:hypothetical protein